jgi:hypothetical protein
MAMAYHRHDVFISHGRVGLRVAGAHYPRGRAPGTPPLLESTEKEIAMSGHVYKHIELTGSSTVSSDDAVRRAIEKAAQTVRNIHWFQVVETRGHVVEDKVAHWQVTLKVGFTLED